MVLDSWTLGRTHRMFERFRNEPTLPKRPKTSGPVPLDSNRLQTPGRALVEALSRELASAPTPPKTASVASSSYRLPLGRYDVSPDLRSNDLPGFKPPPSVGSTRSLPTPTLPGSMPLSDGVSERSDGPPSGVYRRPQWANVDVLPPKHRAYRDHSEYNRIINSNYIPGLSKVPALDNRPPAGHTPQTGSQTWVRPETPKSQQLPSLGNTTAESTVASNNADFEDTNLAMEKLRKMLYKSYAAHMDGGLAAMAAERDLFSAFDCFDMDRDGVICMEEFLVMAKRLMPDANPDQLAMVFAALDKDEDGKIDFYEFMRANVLNGDASSLERELMKLARPKKASEQYLQAAAALQGGKGLRKARGVLAAQEVKDSVERAVNNFDDPTRAVAMQLVRTRMKNMGLDLYAAGDIMKSFEFFDANRNGKITREELANVFKTLKVPITDDNVSFIFQTFDKDQSGELDYAEFVKHFFPHKSSLYKPRGR